MNDKHEMEGGCLCGAVRYRVSSAPFEAEYCHCRMCQKSTGSAAVNWMDFKSEQLTWTRGRPSEYASSETVRRGFCAECGCSLTFRDTRHPDYVTLTIPSLDDPNQVVPTRHIYTESQLNWFSVADQCRRFPRSPANADD